MKKHPSIFQPWTACDSDLSEPYWETVARHDLVIHVPEFFQMHWEGYSDFRMPAPLNPRIDATTIPYGLNIKKQLQILNPDILLLCQINYRECADENGPSFLTPDHPWWLRDSQGQRIRGWETNYKLNVNNPELQQHVVDSAVAVLATGVFDGIMLDVWEDGPAELSTISKLREAIGDKLIICNCNYFLCPNTAPYMNGVYMECGQISARVDQWPNLLKALEFNERTVREPKITCLEFFSSGTRDDYGLMHAVTCLSLVHTNGYCLFSDASGSHAHSWYRFWDKDLGSPLSPGYTVDRNGFHVRLFEKGRAVFNPYGNKSTIYKAGTMLTSVITNNTNNAFIIYSPGGGIYLNDKGK